MNTFPLAPFLYALIADGISVSFDDYDRISTVLGTGDKWTRSRLRGVLLALLAHNKEQAERFERRFDSFFPEPDSEEFSEADIHGFLIQLHEIAREANETDQLPTPTEIVVPLTSNNPNGSSSDSRKSIWAGMLKQPLFWCLAISLFFVGVLILLVVRKESVKEVGSGTTPVASSTSGTASPTPAKITPSSTATPRPLSRPSRNTEEYSDRIRLNAIDPVQVLPSRHRWTDLLATLGLVALLFLLWMALTALVSKALKDPPPQFNPNSPRLFPFSALGEALKPQLDGPTLDQLADSINYFLSPRPSKRLNIDATIKATGRNAGMPALCFHRQKQVRRICIFEDSRSEPLVWNKVTSELLEGLLKRGVDVLYGQFAGSLDLFLMRDGTRYWLEELDNEKRDSIFLFFSDGKQIRNRRDIFALERLAKLPLVVWFDLREPKFWDETAYLIKTYGIPLYQANPDGLKRAFDLFLMESGAENDDSGTVSHWRGFPPFTDGQLAVYIEHLLGDSLVWAQACAMIQPLSLKMAHTLRRSFQSHLPAERIERLFRLPGTTWQASCLCFSQPVLAALRGGFTTRLSPREQDAILDFIQQQIRFLEPPKCEKSLRRLAWEWTLRRVQLESAPDEVLPILSQLSQTPLGAEIKRDLSHLVFVDQPATTIAESQRIPIPLRARPFTKKGIAYLKELSPQTVISNSLPESISLNWQRLQFIITRVWKYIWQQQVFWWERALIFLQLKVKTESSTPSSLTSQVKILADPPELRIKRLFAGQIKTLSLTFKTSSDDWLAGRIVSDNEWLMVNPSYCDGQDSEKTVNVVIETRKLKPGEHASNITFLPADGSESLDVPVSVEIYRSWKEVADDWWRKHRPKHPVRATIAMFLLISAVVFLTFKVLPGNWFNRTYNHPPVLHIIRAKTGEDLPDNMLALEAIAEDADGDTLRYEWLSDWGKVVGDGQNPILVGVPTKERKPVKLTLVLKDARGGDNNYSTSIQLSKTGGEPRLYLDSARGSFDYPDVQVLLSNLKNGSSRERWIAASSLAYVDLQREQVVPALISSLHDPDPEVLQAVIPALSHFGSDARLAVPTIIEHLKMDRDSVRIVAAQALASFIKDHETTVPALLEALKDENEAVGRAAADSLGTIGPDAKPALVELLNKPPPGSTILASRVRRLAAVALAGINMNPEPDILSALLGVLRATDTDAELRRTAAYTIAQLRPSDSETTLSLVSNMQDKAPQVRSAVVSALWSISSQGKIEPSVVPALFEALKDENAEVRRTAISALGNIATEDENLETKLLETLKDEDADVRHAAAAALGTRRGNSSIVPQLIAILQNPVFQRSGAAEALGQIKMTDTAAAVEALKVSLGDSNLELRRASGYALTKLAAKDERATEALLDYLNNKDPDLRNAAISAVWGVKGSGLKQSALDSKEAMVTNALVGALGDQSAFVRSHAASALRSFKIVDSAVISALTNAVLNDKDGDVATSALASLSASDEVLCSKSPELLSSRFADVRYQVLRLLTRYPLTCLKDGQEGSVQLKEKLLDLINDDDLLVRVGFVYYFYFNPDSLDIFTTISKLLKNPNFAVRISAVKFLSSHERPEAFSLLLGALHDQDPRVRRTAALYLGLTGNKQAKPYLQEALQDRDPRVHDASLCALLYLKYSETGRLSDSDQQFLEDISISGGVDTSNMAEWILRRLVYFDYERDLNNRLSRIRNRSYRLRSSP
jgi:HEAT repeat protein